MQIFKPEEVIQKFISPQEFFPGNLQYPLLIYRQVFSNTNELPAQAIQAHLGGNQWHNSWVGGIYDFHHYHSNSHETLVIISGHCEVQFGGELAEPAFIGTVSQGDVVIIPAGVAHKSLTQTDNFRCIGAYPSGADIEKDMHYGTEQEYLEAVKRIPKIGLPKRDPVFGTDGLMFQYWRAEENRK